MGTIASVTGRYYAMDRDNRWDRVEKAYAAFVYGEGNHGTPVEVMEKSYAEGVTDEFVVPAVTCEGGRVAEGDSVIFFNFRPDRAREITRTFVDDAFTGFARRYGPFSGALRVLHTVRRHHAQREAWPSARRCSPNVLGEYLAEKRQDAAAHCRDRKVRPCNLLLQRRRRGPFEGRTAPSSTAPRWQPTTCSPK